MTHAPIGELQSTLLARLDALDEIKQRRWNLCRDAVAQIACVIFLELRRRRELSDSSLDGVSARGRDHQAQPVPRAKPFFEVKAGAKGNKPAGTLDPDAVAERVGLLH